jgi:hypothetical protein
LRAIERDDDHAQGAMRRVGAWRINRGGRSMTQGAFTPRFGPGFGGRGTRVPLAVAALFHVLVVALLLQARLPPQRPTSTIVETLLLELPRRARPAPAPVAPPARAHPTADKPKTSPAPETVPLRTLPAPGVIVAAPLPASAPSAPRPGLRLDLSPAELRALVSSHQPGLAETISPSVPPPSALARVAGAGEALSERRLPDGSIETHIHGECYVQEQSVANKLDPIGHAHDAPLLRGCDR